MAPGGGRVRPFRRSCDLSRPVPEARVPRLRTPKPSAPPVPHGAGHVAGRPSSAAAWDALAVHDGADQPRACGGRIAGEGSSRPQEGNGAGPTRPCGDHPRRAGHHPPACGASPPGVRGITPRREGVDAPKVRERQPEGAGGPIVATWPTRTETSSGVHGCIRRRSGGLVESQGRVHPIQDAWRASPPRSHFPVATVVHPLVG